MTHPASNLLIAAAVDLGRHGWPEGTADRMAGALAWGKGGKVSRLAKDDCLLFARQRGGGTGQALTTEPGSGPVVLFAGYLSDRSQLRTRLGLPADQPLSDGSLYAAAYASWGEGCDNQLNGHYSVILWFPEEGRLRAARSPVDPSPLHWWSDGSRVIVATTPRAIFAAGVPRELDDDKLDAALTGRFDEPTRSWFANIQRLEGGTAMTWCRSGSLLQRYWSLDSVPDIRLKRDADYVEALDSLFAHATAEALGEFRRPGLLLSGGLDSQAVASYALDAMQPGTPLACYTSVPEAGFSPVARVDTFPDERAHVEAMAEINPRLRLNFVDAAGRDFTDHLAELFVGASALPLAALNLHWVHASLAMAAADGCDVMLTGSSGNAGFSFDGETAFAGWLRQGRLVRLLRELRGIDEHRPLHRRLISLALMPNLPNSLQTRLARLHEKTGEDSENASPFKEAYARQRGLDIHAAAPRSRTSRQARDRLLAMGACEGGDIELGLELMHGIPMRDPTAYRPLLEFCVGIPDDQYRRGGVSRWLARRLLKGRVPENVRLDRRIGQQGADWPLRLNRNRARLMAELKDLAEDPELCRKFDFARTSAALASWNGNDARQSGVFETVALATSRTIVASRFIRFVSGSNR